MVATEMVETGKPADDGLLSSFTSEGPLTAYLKEYLLDEARKKESESEAQNEVHNIFLNAVQAVPYLVDPKSANPKETKTLCIGKIQSGKTGFFIAAIALAFDNGYDIAYVFAGSTNNLKSQDRERIYEDFKGCSRQIMVTDINSIADGRTIRESISAGRKVIVIILKNSNHSKGENNNLPAFKNLADELSDMTSIVVDDEGDEISPGRLKGKEKLNVGSAHKDIIEALSSIKRVSYLSVTATPQANLLMATVKDKEISPDYCVLVRPGEGYTGGNVFHDAEGNPLVKPIEDTTDFENGAIPDSLKEAIEVFLIGCAIAYIDHYPQQVFSMLIHPSRNQAIHEDVKNIVERILTPIKKHLQDERDPAYDTYKNEILSVYRSDFPTLRNKPNEADLVDAIKKNFPLTSFHVVNSAIPDKSKRDQDLENFEDSYNYRIYIGGNMLQRGITLKNLIVTYIYRVAKQDNTVDTLEQRARWFGYKKNYLDICRVFMPPKLLKAYIGITDSENTMWEDLEAFLSQNIHMKSFPRHFHLPAGEDDLKLLLTRKTVSGTVNISVTTTGYIYDRSITFKAGEKEQNNRIIQDFLKGKTPERRPYGNFIHDIYTVSFEDCYNNFLSKFHFAQGAHRLTQSVFRDINEAVSTGQIPNSIKVVVMRSGRNEYRDCSDGLTIPELPQSYDNDTGYEGDKGLSGLKDCLHIQIHNIAPNKKDMESTFPLLALNNTVSKEATGVFTGTNDYGQN
jgi:hypothetical protein